MSGGDDGALRRHGRDGGTNVRRDAGFVDPLGPRKGGRAELSPSPAIRIESSLTGSPLLDAGYGAAASPTSIALPAYQAHVFASEELGPDALRKLIRPGVTLWLDTKTNMLRESTLEVLRANRGRAFVKLKAPLVDAHQRRFATLPSGVWVDGAELDKLSLHWIGSRPIAIELNGEGTPAQWSAIRAARPVLIFWAKPGCRPQAWAAAKAMKSIIVTVDTTPCELSGAPVSASYRGMAPSTERAPFIWIRPDAAPARVRDLYVRAPATQLLLSVGDRAADVRKVSALLDALEGERQ
jgi:hypothetical protein